MVDERGAVFIRVSGDRNSKGKVDFINTSSGVIEVNGCPDRRCSYHLRIWRIPYSPYLLIRGVPASTIIRSLIGKALIILRASSSVLLNATYR